MLDLTNLCLSFLICGSTMLSVIAIRYNGRRSGSLKQKRSWVTSIVFCVFYCSTTFFTLFFVSLPLILEELWLVRVLRNQYVLISIHLWCCKPHLGVSECEQSSMNEQNVDFNRSEERTVITLCFTSPCYNLLAKRSLYQIHSCYRCCNEKITSEKEKL